MNTFMTGAELDEEIKAAWKSRSERDALLKRYESALRSIAASSCCDRCNEAKLVAQAALHDGQYVARIDYAFNLSSPEPPPQGTDVAPVVSLGSRTDASPQASVNAEAGLGTGE